MRIIAWQASHAWHEASGHPEQPLFPCLDNEKKYFLEVLIIFFMYCVHFSLIMFYTWGTNKPFVPLFANIHLFQKHMIFCHYVLHLQQTFTGGREIKQCCLDPQHEADTTAFLQQHPLIISMTQSVSQSLHARLARQCPAHGEKIWKAELIHKTQVFSKWNVIAEFNFDDLA